MSLLYSLSNKGFMVWKTCLTKLQRTMQGNDLSTCGHSSQLKLPLHCADSCKLNFFSSHNETVSKYMADRRANVLTIKWKQPKQWLILSVSIFYFVHMNSSSAGKQLGWFSFLFMSGEENLWNFVRAQLSRNFHLNHACHLSFPSEIVGSSVWKYFQLRLNSSRHVHLTELLWEMFSKCFWLFANFRILL